MRSSWRHFREIKAACPTCGKPAHLGRSRKTRDYYWLHDSVDDYFFCHGDQDELCLVEREQAELLRESCIEVEAPRRATTGKRRCVRCVETGEVFKSIKAAADHIGVAAASVSVALKKGSRSGGYRWEYLD